MTTAWDSLMHAAWRDAWDDLYVEALAAGHDPGEAEEIVDQKILALTQRMMEEGWEF